MLRSQHYTTDLIPYSRQRRSKLDVFLFFYDALALATETGSLQLSNSHRIPERILLDNNRFWKGNYPN